MNFELISHVETKDKFMSKTTEAMEIEDVGCLINVTIQKGDQIAASATFVPGVIIEDSPVGKKLVQF
jgi:hypothetical protein